MAHKDYQQVGVGSTVELGNGGTKLKENSGIMESRNNADSAYAVFRAATPVGDDDVVTKGWVERRYGIKITGQINGGSPPAASSYGRIFICTTAGGAYTLKYLYRDTGSAWEEIVPIEGMTVAVTDALSGGTDEYEADTVYVWDADAGTWDKVGPIIDPNTGLMNHVKVTLTHTDTGDNNVGSALPSGAVVMSVSANVSQVFDGSVNELKVGDGVDDDRFLGVAGNDLTEVMLFRSEHQYLYGSSTQVIANLVATGASQGQVEVLVKYLNP